jgi:hypothetical protein
MLRQKANDKVMIETRRDKRESDIHRTRFVFAGRQGEQWQEGKDRGRTRGNKMTDKVKV